MGGSRFCCKVNQEFFFISEEVVEVEKQEERRSSSSSSSLPSLSLSLCAGEEETPPSNLSLARFLHFLSRAQPRGQRGYTSVDVGGGLWPGGRCGRGERDDDKLCRSDAATIDVFGDDDDDDDDDATGSGLRFRPCAARGPGLERRVVPGASQGTSNGWFEREERAERGAVFDKSGESICFFRRQRGGAGWPWRRRPPLKRENISFPCSTLPSTPRTQNKKTKKQVQGSPSESKREFLRGKGLTEAEIDEAFRRAPPDTSSPSAAAAAGAPSSSSPPPPPAPPQPTKSPPLRWTQVALRLGAAAAATAGVAHVAAPRYRAWADSRAEAEEEAEA